MLLALTGRDIRCGKVPHGRATLRTYSFRRAEYDVEFDPPRAYCFSTRDDASESGAALLNATFVHLHFLECVFVDEV